MAAAGIPSAREATITMSCVWKGPNTSDRLPLSVKVVDLAFRNAAIRASVHIPDKIDPDRCERLRFECLEGEGLLKRTRQTDALTVPIDQIRNLVLKAGVFDPSQRRGAISIDSRGKVTHETFVIRSDRRVGVQMPAKLEAGGKYQLLIHSDSNMFLTARLIEEKEVPADRSLPKEPPPMTPDQEIVACSLTALMPGLIDWEIIKHNHRIGNVQCDWTIAHDLSKNPTIIEIQKIDPAVLLELSGQCRILGSRYASQSPEEQFAATTETSKKAIRAIGPQGFVNIMRATLEKLLQGDTKKATQDLITEISEVFRKVYEEKAK